MVSFHSSFSPPVEKNAVYKQEINLSYLNKRKWEQQGGGGDRSPERTKHLREESKDHETVDVSLHLSTPLSLDWQQSLHLHTDQVHYYDSRNQKKTIEDDPRLSLDLQLNLPNDQSYITKSYERSLSGHSRSLSWMSLKEEEKEMVAAVCMRCHMLVMLCKSSPACPNCKFLHPPIQDTHTLDLFHVQPLPTLL